MSILDFATQDDLDNLDEDARIGFMQLVNLCQRGLARRIQGLNPEIKTE
jgi:hypothetical protein